MKITGCGNKVDDDIWRNKKKVGFVGYFQSYTQLWELRKKNSVFFLLKRKQLDLTLKLKPQSGSTLIEQWPTEIQLQLGFISSTKISLTTESHWCRADSLRSLSLWGGTSASSCPEKTPGQPSLCPNQCPPPGWRRALINCDNNQLQNQVRLRLREFISFHNKIRQMCEVQIKPY